MRKRAHLEERIEVLSPLMVYTKEEIDSFRDGKAIYLEIGCGKGKFIRECALRDAEIPHLAVEHYDNVAILAAEAAEREGIKNIRFSFSDIEKLDGEIEEGSVKRIYLNFSDPWPKKKQAKRRLTHPSFLKMYKKWLSDDGEIFFKTDNEKLFEFSLNSFCSENFLLSNITFDLHKSDFEGNIMTEYETKFAEEGKNIFRLEARKRL
ncbi:MAG: tRNA (guanosine(46)-N7)-methyltransferase TrmB [Clostridia bacterium]|nr:tRNA (guanosine(46)-N7)-methyltransferase TrmB [Clostridia bacterium]